MTLPEPAFKLAGISPRAFQHPADRAATAALKQVPYLDLVIRRLIQLGYERALRQSFLGAGVRLGEDQLPHVWVVQREVYNALDLSETPDLYLTHFPLANAAVIGAGAPIVVLSSELVGLVDSDGMRAVLAHEAAHVLADHVVYETALLVLLQIGTSVRLPVLAGLPLLGIRAALLEWARAAELSCDRAAALVTRDPLVVCRSLMAIAAGAAASELNLDAFMAQGIEYSERGAGIDRLTRLFADMRLTHPQPVRRVHELLAWVRSGDYDRIVDGDYPRRGDEWRLREETDVAAAHYGDRVRDAFRDAGESIADVGKQLSDWLSRQRD